MSINTLKTRDDPKPLSFTADGESFELLNGFQASWLNGEKFGQKELRNRIEPWLTSLFQPFEGLAASPAGKRLSYR